MVIVIIYLCSVTGDVCMKYFRTLLCHILDLSLQGLLMNSFHVPFFNII